MKTFLFLLLLSFAAVVRAETPNQAAAAIVSLVKSESYSELFRTRYSEWYKVESEDRDPDEVVGQLSQRWKKHREILLSGYMQLTTAEFTFTQNAQPLTSETGEIATAKVLVDGRAQDFKFYKLKNGLWGFHQ